MGKRKGAVKVTVQCHGCDKTQTLRPSKIERCDAYACTWEHGPREELAPGLVREIVYNAAGGFWGWRDVLATEEDAQAVRRAREIAVLGVAESVVHDAARRMASD
ncbi:hypothetical protein FHR32_008825 [Streptosporangium album]|uniref:Uncharacterized protein n=1 Tax=Streptosporangium album TaxID=47479 RepID=A0A7W7S5R5_9ACTN|nr:hypothetical protein [Streptosporangium album]MBB4944419.1 hypothetical protein [Streptosporangium album]